MSNENQAPQDAAPQQSEQEAAPRQQTQNAPSQQQDGLHPRRPDYRAYQVQDTPDGKGAWNPIGAAWTHRDGKGMQLQLDSIPVSGRVTLREMRQERMNSYAENRAEQQAQNPNPSHNVNRGYVR